jgi:hypothetical protein
MISERAPDFGPGSGFPSGGERIGPAWRDMWIYLRRTGWRTAAEVTLTPTVARHDLDPKTITNLLQQARRYGLLDVRYARCGDPVRRRALYRIKGVPVSTMGSAPVRPVLNRPVEPPFRLLPPRPAPPDDGPGWYWDNHAGECGAWQPDFEGWEPADHPGFPALPWPRCGRPACGPSTRSATPGSAWCCLAER